MAVTAHKPSNLSLYHTSIFSQRILCFHRHLHLQLQEQQQQLRKRLPQKPLLQGQQQQQQLRKPFVNQSRQQQQPRHHPGSFENTWLSIIKSCSTKARLLQIHAHLIRTSLIHRPDVLGPFLSSAAALDVDYSRQIFFQIPNATFLLYDAALKVYSRSSSPEQAFDVYSLMRKQAIRPTPFSSSFVLNSCIRMQSVTGAKQIHARILLDGHQSDSVLLTSLMDFYSMSGDGDGARQVFDEMPQRDTVAWNVLISCYVRNGRTKDALALFDAMQAPSHHCKPDDVTCSLLLQACAKLGALDFGYRVHNYINERGYGNALNMCNSLIAMYSKCGCVDKAFRVFGGMVERNVVSWSAMISGLAMNGHGREAIEAFWEMRRVGISPDDQTFTGVLSACSHSGLVDEGLKFFDLMKFEYGLAPNIHHYGCMVDLLGRAGLFKQACHLIDSMTIEPDSTIWRTLLGACRIHRNLALGELVIGNLIQLKGQQSGDYVLLVNMYASAGNWEKVAEVRHLMKEKRIQTLPGCSTIELKGVVHEFIVDDDSHPRKKEIYEMLNDIGKQLKIAGYIPDMTSELHNLDVEGKENTLSYHSEKLAIGFGMLVTPPGTTIRIAKNLRICVDCHNFAKVLSGAYNRIIIVRDRRRFHHFREGSCSCNDYW